MKQKPIFFFIISILQFFVVLNLFAFGIVPVDGLEAVKDVRGSESRLTKTLGSNPENLNTNSLDNSKDKDVNQKSEDLSGVNKMEAQEEETQIESDTNESEVMKVSYYINRDPENGLVLLPKGTNDGVRNEAIFRAYRLIGGVHAPTGILKVVRVYPNESVARVIEDGLSEEGLVGKFVSVMAGDEVMEYSGEIYRKEQIVENIELRYKDIFEEWGRDSLVMNLSDKGKRLIRSKFHELMDQGIKKIMIESYSGTEGSYSSNQIESEQRGKVVKYFIDEEFGLDKDDVVVIGFGKSEPQVVGNSDKIQNSNRKIVIRAI